MKKKKKLLLRLREKKSEKRHFLLFSAAASVLAKREASSENAPAVMGLEGGDTVELVSKHLDAAWGARKACELQKIHSGSTMAKKTRRPAKIEVTYPKQQVIFFCSLHLPLIYR